ncbi:glycosyltransferase family 4 protein [Agromyces salentinus]|uniref:Glycosyltransferase family 1 protein n=1 Tax=Agromyces salentinus TaxID=269421 RepID=A0ABN2MME9_9MICO|nr:glycosyltransferase family 1 protein [Agromyces salentinus]
MRVLFDAFWWGRGPVSNRQVMREFIWAWAEEFPDDELVVAVRSRHVGVARGEVPDGTRIVGTRMSPQGLSAILELPFVARRVRADVTLVHNFTPAFGRSAVFVHDFMFLRAPEWFTRKELAYFRLMPLTIGRASVVFTSSATEAAAIRPSARGRAVVPVGLAVGRVLEEAVPTRPGALDGVDDFLLSVGRLNVRKNLTAALQGALASGIVSPTTPIVVVGESQGRSTDLPDDVLRASSEGSVRFLGRADDAELSWLYRHTRGLVFLSLDEGFGMPTLEAVRFGAPVVASDIPVFREILGGHAVYADPRDVDAIAEAVRALPARDEIEPVSPAQLGYGWPMSVRAMRDSLTASTALVAGRQ